MRTQIFCIGYEIEFIDMEIISTCANFFNYCQKAVCIFKSCFMHYDDNYCWLDSRTEYRIK